MHCPIFRVVLYYRNSMQARLENIHGVQFSFNCNRYSICASSPLLSSNLQRSRLDQCGTECGGGRTDLPEVRDMGCGVM
jgi:hypothetical protein